MRQVTLQASSQSQRILVDQQPHQLGDRDRRMGVVELHGEFLVEAAQRELLGAQDAHHVLQRAGDEEILLLEAQLLAAQLLVVRVEDLAEVLRRDLLVHRAVVVAAVEDREIERLGRLRAPQPQRVRRVGAVAEDRRVVGHAVHDLVRAPSAPAGARARRRSSRCGRRI